MASEADLRALYPFLHGAPQEPEKLDAALLHSIEEKARDSRETNARFFAAEAAILFAAAKAVADVYRRGGRLFSMGNGGSSCDASHVAVEFVHPITAGRPALAAINLVADIAMISAVGNDVGFDQVFVRQVIAQARAGDGLIGISTSGNSANLIAAFAKAKEMGLATIGLAGGDGGKMTRRRRRRSLSRRADDLDPPHPGMSRRRLSHPVGSRSHAARRRSRLRHDQGSGGMKYLDEFRDRRQGGRPAARRSKALVASIAIPDDRPLQIMEVCGGHTHSIFRYGVEGMLPKPDRARAWARMPGLRAADGARRRLRRHRRAAGVIFTTFGDAMRVPGSRKSLLQAKADGADVRMVYSPMDALALARANPDREVVFFGLGFETTMPSTALTMLQAEREGDREFLGLLQSHHHRADDQGDPRQPGSAGSTAFSGPGHVSMVIGDAPYEFIARYYRKPMVIAGFEPLDILQSIWMVLKQIKEGRGEIENQYARVVPDAGNAPALQRGRAGLRTARILRVAGPGLDRSLRRQAARRLCAFRRRAQIRHSQRQDRRSEILPVRRGAQGRHQAAGSARCSARPARRRRRSAR